MLNKDVRPCFYSNLMKTTSAANNYKSLCHRITKNKSHTFTLMGFLLL